MRKIFLVLIGSALLLGAAGCGGEELPLPTDEPPTSVATPSPEVTSTPWPTTVPGAATCHLAPPIGVEVENLPPVTEEDWVRGPADAPVTVVEYADFQ